MAATCGEVAQVSGAAVFGAGDDGFFVVPMVSCLYPHFGSAKDESRVKIGGYISWGDIKKQWY